MTNYDAEAQAVADAMNAVYENKQTNKKNSISGDYSSDNSSYPTVKAVKAEFGTKVTSITGSGSDSNYPSEKLLKTELDKKISTSQTPGLVKNDGTIDTSNYLTSHQSLSDIGGVVTVEKQQTAESGYVSTYVVKQNGIQVGSKINIEKDKMLRTISVETVGSTPTTEESTYNMSTGDQYIKMVVNTVDNDGTTNIILPITDVFDLQTADESTLTLSAGGVFSIKNSGVDTAQIKNGAVTSDKIATSFKNSLVTTSDVQSEISDFATALAAAINPSSS